MLKSLAIKVGRKVRIGAEDPIKIGRACPEATRSSSMAVPNTSIPNFSERAQFAVAGAASARRLAETRQRRIMRRFSMREVSEFLGYRQAATLAKLLEHPDAPETEMVGRERQISLSDMMKLRALSARPGHRNRINALHWRQPGDPLPVIAFCSQKGGSGKSISACHVAQGASLHYGLRVGVIDCDPQATASLYFVDGDIEVAGHNIDTFTTFMGVPAPGKPAVEHSDMRLNEFWKSTPWPGLRIIPGGAIIQEADISMYFLAQREKTNRKRVYRLLRDTLDHWSAAYPPKTRHTDLFDAEGRLHEEVYAHALTETLDLVIIDSAPSLTLSQLNAVVAADMLCCPTQMRGFDLSTLQIYLSSLTDYMLFVRSQTDPVQFRSPQPSYILPTIISPHSDTDMRQLGELYAQDPEVVCPVFFSRSEAVANAARQYQSIYEYLPPRSRRKSAADFTFNANAVCDAILSRAIPRLTPLGFANEFIRRTYPDGQVPPWTSESELMEEAS